MLNFTFYIYYYSFMVSFDYMPTLVPETIREQIKEISTSLGI